MPASMDIVREKKTNLDSESVHSKQKLSRQSYEEQKETNSLTFPYMFCMTDPPVWNEPINVIRNMTAFVKRKLFSLGEAAALTSVMSAAKF